MKWLLLLVVVAQRLYFFWQFPLCAEDAYITFHAAVDPSWMKAATSPIYAMLLGLGDPPMLARILALVGDLVACSAVIKTAKPEGSILFCLFWCTPFITGSAISGLETHLAACALVAGLTWPLALSFAGWRPDAIAMSFAASGRRWRGPTIGAAVYVVAASLLAGGLPQTMGSKLATYGVHWFKGWYWWHSEGLGWLELALIAGGLWAAVGTSGSMRKVLGSQQMRYFLTALAPICLHWTLGTPNFWWYVVPSAAMLGALYCKAAGRKTMMVGTLAILLCWNQQSERLDERTWQEKMLWEAGQQFASMKPQGTVFLEPAGIIPWSNRNLRVIDEIGLVDPWISKRREEGDGWMGDALRHFKPEWMVVRTRFLRDPEQQFTGRSKPFRNVSELYQVLDSDPGYWVMAIATVDGVRVRYLSCDMAILQRKDLVTLPPNWKPVMTRVFDPPAKAK